MAEAQSIQVYDRRAGRGVTEQVYGDALVRWLYGSPSGRMLADGFLSGHLVSKAYGAYQSSSLSRRKIAPFIRDFRIPMQEYEAGPFATFNDFFIRRFAPGARSFAPEPSRMPAFVEARYLAWSRIEAGQVFPVKGMHLSAAALLGAADAKPFEGGPLLLARLCPVDYHRFHYPDAGSTLRQYRLGGKLHSVNPLALRYRSEILATNERHVSILDTVNFGKLAYVEVGAMCVGLIHQSHATDAPFDRGDEKGYFLFGASTVIVLGEPGRWRPDQDVLDQTARRRESLVRLGEGIARAGG